LIIEYKKPIAKLPAPEKSQGVLQLALRRKILHLAAKMRVVFDRGLEQWANCKTPRSRKIDDFAGILQLVHKDS
jgi:hypothetical protein